MTQLNHLLTIPSRQLIDCFTTVISYWENKRIFIDFKIDFADIQVQLSSLSDILEHIKTNATTTGSSVSSRSIVSSAFRISSYEHCILSQDGSKTSGGHTPSASISSINSFILLDAQRQDYFEISKKGLFQRRV